MIPFNLYKQFWTFIKNPNYKEEILTDNQKIINVLWLLLLEFLVIFPIVIFRYFWETYGSMPENKKPTIDLTLVLVGTTIVPFIEELIFRKPLNSPKYSIGFSVLFLLYLIVFLLSSEKMIYITVVSISWGSFCLFYPLEKKHLMLWKKQYKWIFYWFAILFGLAHLVNYKLENTEIWVMPLLVISQIIGGFFLGFIRIKYGLKYSILNHSLFNSILMWPAFLID